MNANTRGGASTGFIVLIVAVATLGGLMFGYDSGAINGTQAGLRQAFGLSETALGLTVSALLPGSALGAFLAGRLADLWGRRFMLTLTAALFLLSALASGAAPSALVLALARFFAGMAVGGASVLSPVYISEVAPARIRGRLATAQQVMIISGLTAAFLANYLLAHLAGSSLARLWGGLPAWRWMFLVQAGPALLFLVALQAIPESPRYLAAKGRAAEATRVLARLLGEQAARAKLAEIAASLDPDHAPRLSDLRGAGGRVRPIVWVGIGLAMLQQLVGINVIFYYGAVLWQAVGFSEADALKINVLSGAVSILACFVSIALVDRIGRRALLRGGSLGMALSLATLAVCFTGAREAGGALALPGALGPIALVAANVYVFCFNFSWGPVMWVMLGEMFPNRLRGSALAVAGAAQWLTNFAVSSSFPWLARHAGLSLTYGGYTAFAVLSFLFVGRAVQETKGIELEAMPG